MSAAKLIAIYHDVVCHSDQNVPSPCVSVCAMDPAKAQCGGCFRTIDEIAAWSRMSDVGKKQVWEQLVQRMQAQVFL